MQGAEQAARRSPRCKAGSELDTRGGPEQGHAGEHAQQRGRRLLRALLGADVRGVPCRRKVLRQRRPRRAARHAWISVIYSSFLFLFHYNLCALSHMCRALR